MISSGIYKTSDLDKKNNTLRSHHHTLIVFLRPKYDDVDFWAEHCKQDDETVEWQTQTVDGVAEHHVGGGIGKVGWNLNVSFFVKMPR